MPTNDNHMTPLTASASDPSGMAALLLVESLIHGLCENETLTNDQAIEITARAADIQQERAEESEGGAVPMRRSHVLLSTILASLQTEGRGTPFQPRLV